MEREGEVDAVDDVHELARGIGSLHPDVADLERLRSGQTLIALCNPLGNPTAIQTLGCRGVTVSALELLPRIARDQSMDVLSSTATVAG